MPEKSSEKPAAPSKNAENADIALLRQLAQILNETDLTEVELADGNKKLKVKREVTVAAAASYAPVAMAAPAASAAPAAAPAPAAATTGENVLASPMVGTAYLSPKPGDPAFVKVGDAVKEGQTVLIIEAMKVMNPIKAHKSGTVGSINVTDAQPVEFGQALLTIN